MDQWAGKDYQDGPFAWNPSNNIPDSLSAPEVLNPGHLEIWVPIGDEGVVIVFLHHKDCSGNSKDPKVVQFDKSYMKKILIMSLDSYTTSFFILRFLLLQCGNWDSFLTATFSSSCVAQNVDLSQWHLFFAFKIRY